VYTADPRARNEFRSTGAHSTLCVGGAEQSRLRSDYLFALAEEAHARCLRFAHDGPRTSFEGEHEGFRALPRAVRHRRELHFDGERASVRIVDTVIGARGEELLWSFPLAPGVAAVEGTRVFATFPLRTLAIETEDATLEVHSGWLAPSYGVRVAAPVVRARRVAQSDEEVTRFTFLIGMRF
jgi:hypothetical protein